jgi:hypothetical protein
MSGMDVDLAGVTFETVRLALTTLYFEYDGMTPEQFEEAKRYVVPMQHNWQNPIEPGSQDTWITYWIDEDDAISSDHTTNSCTNEVHKVAHITVKFLGKRAEQWAKVFHHMTRRRSPDEIFRYYCNAGRLWYVSPIVPMSCDWFGTGNTTISYQLGFNLEYNEILGLPENEPLTYISMGAGVMSELTE